LDGRTIHHAYRTATQTAEPRNAYRWLHKLQRKLVDYRALLTPRVQPASQFTLKNKQRTILLSSLQPLLSMLGSCAQIQQHTQTAFV